MKHIWNQIKYFVKNEILDRPWRTGFLINAVVTISIWTAHCEYEKLSIKHINILENANRSLMNEQLDLLEQLRDNFVQNTNSIGNISIQRYFLKQQELQLNEQETIYLSEFESLRKEEEELLSKLKDRYGDGQIDINEGTFIPS